MAKELEGENRVPWEMLVQDLQKGVERESMQISSQSTHLEPVDHPNRKITADGYFAKTSEMTTTVNTSSKELNIERKRNKPNSPNRSQRSSRCGRFTDKDH